MRTILGIHRAASSHWVGNGFPVKTLFTYERLGDALSPFLMLDHAGPTEFPPTDAERGVGEHAHRGFETVTLVFAGEIEHRDSTGSGGRVGPGDVQWMTAAGGIVHEEFHSADFTRRGGALHIAQLWVNLPARSKMSRPNYQTLLAKDIPSVELQDKRGSLRIIAGDYEGTKGPARTFTAVNVWDARLQADARWSVPIAAAQTACVVVLSGTVVVNHVERVGADNVVIFERSKGEIIIDADRDSHLLILSGEPLNEPIVGYGPFVMNTTEEIQQAITDLHRGDFGQVRRADEWMVG
ncbi:MAG TPA: pirin family protein [Povalibacter sp.]|nr:pirin family protein [Povalibacter sp.]